MMIDDKKIIDEIVTNLKQKNSADIFNVINAYEFAKQKHNGQKRKSGEPYIIHPCQVAQILEKCDFNTDVISAGLLHDTVEDCGVTVEELEKLFNKQIAQIVDSVTAITKDTFTPDSNDIFQDTQSYMKLAIDDKTFQKLISIGKINKFGFYIKFADRLNNLSSISVFPKYKKDAKVMETRKWVIPLAKMLKSKYFYDNLKNLCFIIENENIDFLNFYDKFFENISLYLKDLYNYLNTELLMYLKNNKLSLNKIIITPKTQYEIQNRIKSRFDISSIKNIKESNFVFVPCFNVYIITNENIKYNISSLCELIDDSNLGKRFKIIGVSIDELNNKFLTIKDQNKTIFDMTMLSRQSYTQLQNGTTEYTDIDIIDETLAGGIVTKYITIISPSGEKIKIPEKSTVLDFAFKLHKDIGFSCKYAIINNSPVHSPIYTRLNNGDKVEIVCELKNGLNINIAELRWLAYCKNESTQRILIKYFEKKYNSV